MRVARLVITMCCAFVIATVLLVTGARADEYTKLTYLTFSAPVQVPGMTLPAGTYMFKLADPESGRRAIQIWDEKGTKLFTMLLTIPDEQPEPKDDPVVMFSERPTGAAPAVKSWFYPAERSGYEFIYPKDQAMKIAAAANTPVLAYNTEVKSDADEAALRGAQVGRIDAQGQTAADNTAAAAATTTASTTTTTTTPAPAAQAANQQANRTPPADPAAASPSSAPSSTAAATTTSGSTAAATTTSGADRTSTSTTTTASGAARSDAATAVGTSGQANRASQSPQSAPSAQRAQELPRTASPLATLQLLSIGLIVSALGVRQVRRRYAENR
jgi:hypothetical protein